MGLCRFFSVVPCMNGVRPCRVSVMGRLLVLSAFVMLGRLSYGVSFPDLHYRAADYVDKIIKGVRPEDLPVQLPTKFEPDQRIFPESHRGAWHDRSSNESTFHLPHRGPTPPFKIFTVFPSNFLTMKPSKRSL